MLRKLCQLWEENHDKYTSLKPGSVAIIKIGEKSVKVVVK